MTEEEREQRRQRRRERFQRRTRIIGLGPTEPTIDAEDVFEAFRDARPILRDCVREAGGFALFRQQPRAEGPRTLSFDVGPDGRVQADTIAMDPPPPGELEGCFRQAFSAAELPSPGEDGARVEITLPTRRRGRGDGGVPRGRWRERPEGSGGPPERPPAGEPREDEPRRQRGAGAQAPPEGAATPP